jgi:hypothetical protein
VRLDTGAPVEAKVEGGQTLITFTRPLSATFAPAVRLMGAA